MYEYNPPKKLTVTGILLMIGITTLGAISGGLVGVGIAFLII